MFDASYQHWIRYSTALAKVLPENDVRFELDAEVRLRLQQLSLIIRDLRAQETALQPSRAETDRADAFIRENYARFRSGDISDEEWIQGSSLASTMSGKEMLDTWGRIRYLTEAFYFCAWRLRCVLNGEKRHKFKFLPKIQASEVNSVRNLLIEHPENPSGGLNFNNSLTFTTAGPVMRSSTIIVSGNDGRTDPGGDSVDVGLYVTAERLNKELEEKFTVALNALNAFISTSDQDSGGPVLTPNG
ncbi:hypothetical protein ACPPVO_16045 [Dactylosporangium sp. McL0621]|uniref:hypothetical protein n=1 Tax=Dactylosporangium sp. McL0621 TaxID=3415678 RepID=UPI003CED1678